MSREKAKGIVHFWMIYHKSIKVMCDSYINILYIIMGLENIELNQNETRKNQTKQNKTKN